VNRTELQDLLSALDLTPSRKLGQNFLVDRNIATWIAEKLEITPEDTVVEIGPGTGSLTREVLERTQNLILVERDGRLAAFLADKLKDIPTVEVYNQDACQFDTRSLYPRRPVKVIGNLPYSAGGEIIRNFLGIHSPVEEAVLMLQREVAERIAAPPGGKNFGVLTLRVQVRWNVTLLKHVGPDCFHPRPKIDSTVIRLTPRPADELPVFDPRLFDATIRRGFAQRRKQLRNGLEIPVERWSAITATLGVPESVRGEDLSLRQWVDLTNLLDEHPLKDNPQRQDEMFDVVDDANQVIDQQPRGVVHRDRLKHRAVHIFLFHRNGDLFLQRRSRLKDVAPGRWDSSAAGHLDAGESYDIAARRELQEELGVDAPTERIAEMGPDGANGFEFVELHRAELPSGVKPRWPASEDEFGQFFPVETIDAWVANRPGDFAGAFRQCWAAWRALEDKAPLTHKP
jgi:16S rRNA (adenine1518-N6/adenine1519-N6)-dimethyltransferase